MIFSFCLRLSNGIQQSALTHDVLDEGREGQGLIGFIPGQVGDEACIEIDGNFITGLNLFAGFLAF